MSCFVTLELPDGTQERLAPGEIVGRTWTAALRLDDPAVSEAHAMVSLRGDALKFLALRGRFLVDGQPLAEVDLAEGQTIALSHHTVLRVVDVVLPERVLAVVGEGLPQQVLAGTSTILTWPNVRLVPGVVEGGAAVVWSTGEGWRVREGQESPKDLEAGATLLEGRVRVVAAELATAFSARTWLGVDSPVEIVARYDTVHLNRPGAPPVLLTGKMARMFSDLAVAAAPVGWESLSADLWPELEDRESRRRRWDVLLARLRQRLRAGGVRPDLVQSTGNGLIEVVLGPADVVRDET
jgi:hypothetical protein